MEDEGSIFKPTDLHAFDDFKQKGPEKNLPVKLINFSGSINHNGGLELTLGSGLDDIEFVEVEDLGAIVDGFVIDEQAVAGVADDVLFGGRDGELDSGLLHGWLVRGCYFWLCNYLDYWIKSMRWKLAD